MGTKAARASETNRTKLSSEQQRKKKPTSVSSRGMENISVRTPYASEVDKAVPVQVITNKEIAQTATTSLGDFLQRMPSIGTSGTNNTETTAGGGVSCADIRNLGQKEVLVLMDGKRMAMDASASCVDMNTIPLQLIQSIDLVKDGGEAEFGGDGLAGVIDVKLRHNVDTGGFNIRGGISGHGDAQSGRITAYKGWNFDHNKGNITLFGSYETQSGLHATDRSWAYPLENGKGGKQVSYNAPDPTVITDGHSNGRHPYDYSREHSIMNDRHMGSLYGDAHYDFNKHVTLYSNILYSHKNTSSYQTPQQFTGVPSIPGGMTDPKWQYPTYTDDKGHQIEIERDRFVGLGQRRTEGASDTYTVKAGLKGEIFDKWMYDASYTYGWNQDDLQVENVGNYGAWRHLMGLGPNGLDSGLCASNPGGVCIDPTKPTTGMTQAQLNYMRATTHTHSYYQMRDWNVRVHKHEVVRMPWKGGGFMSLAFGYEHRGEQLAQKFDPLITSGNSMDATAVNTSGGYTSNEGYLQGTIHLLQDVPFAKDLTIGGQGRLASYSTVGLAKNWKGLITWSPHQDITFRGTIGQSVRQPNVYEMYQGASVSMKAQVQDEYRGKDGKLLDPSTQFPIVSVGNPNLRPELGRTYTLGTTYTPHQIPNLSFSFQYWHTRIKNLIGTMPGQNIIHDCVTHDPSEPTCGGKIQRGADNIIRGVNTPYQNLGGERTDGIDWDLHYKWNATSKDTFVISNTLQQLLSYEMQYAPGQAWHNYTGRLLYNQAGSPGKPAGMPKVRDYATVTWRHSNFSFTYMMQYVGGMHLNDGTCDLNNAMCAKIQKDGKALGYNKAHVAGIFSHDITANMQLGRWNMQAGIQNITNKRPPFVPDGGQNTSGSLYGHLFVGRYFFMQAGAAF